MAAIHTVYNKVNCRRRAALRFYAERFPSRRVQYRLFPILHRILCEYGAFQEIRHAAKRLRLLHQPLKRRYCIQRKKFLVQANKAFQWIFSFLRGKFTSTPLAKSPVIEAWRLHSKLHAGTWTNANKITYFHPLSILRMKYFLSGRKLQ